MDDQTRIFCFKINILVGTSMYAHDCTWACIGRTPLSLTLILGVNTLYCKPKILKMWGWMGGNPNLVRIR